MQKRVVAHLFSKITHCSKNPKDHLVFTRPRHWLPALSGINSFQSSHSVFLTSILILYPHFRLVCQAVFFMFFRQNLVSIPLSHTKTVNYLPHPSLLLGQCFSTFVRPRLCKFFFHRKRAQSQQIYSSVHFQFQLSSYIKLT